MSELFSPERPVDKAHRAVRIGVFATEVASGTTKQWLEEAFVYDDDMVEKFSAKATDCASMTTARPPAVSPSWMVYAERFMCSTKEEHMNREVPLSEQFHLRELLCNCASHCSPLQITRFWLICKGVICSNPACGGGVDLGAY